MTKYKVKLYNSANCCISESSDNPSGIFELEIDEPRLQKDDKIVIVEDKDE